ncbi:MAG: hypothetical protein ACE37K_13360 [Planctomycetota bacterium]
MRTFSMAALLAGLLGAQDERPPTAAIDLQLPVIHGCASDDTAAQTQLFATRVGNAERALREALRPLATGTERIEVALLPPSVETRRRVRERCGASLQQRGVVSATSRSLVLVSDRKQSRDDQLHRAVVHVATLLRFRDALADEARRSLGYGWLSTGLAHRAEVLANGSFDTFVVRGVVQRPVETWGGDPWRAAGELLRRGQLPPLPDLLRTESDDFDLGQHVLAFALVDHLITSQAATTHGDAARPTLLAELLATASRGLDSSRALKGVLAIDLATLERRVHDHVRQRAGRLGPDRDDALPQHAVHRHAAVYVYANGPVRPRHRKVVEKALLQRHAAHTSGWQKVDGKPRIAIGPVNRSAGFWHQDEIVKNIPRTWPMVAVLEYATDGKPAAQLDCFRRVRGRRGDDGWMLDPTVGFVAHHNAQLVTDRDDDFSYLAVPDTPTGSHVGGSEFVHRGRVRWADGQRASVGVWTLLEAPRSRTTARWHAVQTALVDWRIAEQSRSLGVRAVRAVADLDRELSPWGTERVFRFPEIPPGLFVARGTR